MKTFLRVVNLARIFFGIPVPFKGGEIFTGFNRHNNFIFWKEDENSLTPRMGSQIRCFMLLSDKPRCLGEFGVKYQIVVTDAFGGMTLGWISQGTLERLKYKS